MRRHLILEDGSVFEGEGFGAPATTFGEIIFDTAMTGYQEIITNPIYEGQMIVFAMPVVGADGIHAEAYESVKPNIRGMIVHDLAEVSTNRQRRMNLDRFLKQHNIPGLAQVDTRALIRHLRESGPQKATIVDYVDDHAVDQLVATVLTNKQVQNTATPKPYANPGRGHHIVVIDFGLKHGILRSLGDYDANVSVLPYTATVDEVLTLDPDGIILSTGPGNPNDLPESVLTLIRVLQSKAPMLGLGLGHELFALANGATLSTLPAEYHGMNHPIQEIISQEIFYAMQGRGYVVDEDSLDYKKLFVTHRDLVDNSIQGLRHRDYPAFSVQFFPDGGPGPLEASVIFADFFETVEDYVEQNNESFN
ncbi:carbamoyl phosphate synthase small subunit [Eupransor demetentiae]|uniref:Carbamoyl phosphate synthase small chain n=1 Tax=Eupransor demetentiae TaxID=3109584 RepID=A0ABM9N4H1_9LACO|nr:Carbamoylphosphate synthase small subunit (CarA) [Lactobacillaceae bacterium LMG 33000]